MARRITLLTCFRLCSVADGYTTSRSFREHLADFFGNLSGWNREARSLPLQTPFDECHENLEDCALQQRNRAPTSPLTVLELGTHNGATTVFLSSIFHRVFAVDNDLLWLRTARERLDAIGGLPNVVFIPQDLYFDNLRLFSLNHIEVVFIDAAHDYASVKSDSIHALQIQSVEWIVYHDYDTVNNAKGFRDGMQVKWVVDEFVEESFLDCGPGSPPPLARSRSEALPARAGGLGLITNGRPEGVLCRVLRTWDWTPQSSALALRNHTVHFSKVVKSESKTFWQKGVLQLHMTKLSVQIWYIFAVDSGWVDVLMQGSWPEPGAICTISAYSLDDMTMSCKGQLMNGKGTLLIPMKARLFQRQTWNLTSDQGLTSIFEVFMNRELTSFVGDLYDKVIPVQVYGFRSTLCASMYRREIQSLQQISEMEIVGSAEERTLRQ